MKERTLQNKAEERKPRTRLTKWLAKIAGKYDGELEPKTEAEFYLNEIAENSGGGSVPEPTISDAGKAIVVNDSGEYALDNVGGGGAKVFVGYVNSAVTSNTVYKDAALTQPYSDFADAFNAVKDADAFKIVPKNFPSTSGSVSGSRGFIAMPHGLAVRNDSEESYVELRAMNAAGNNVLVFTLYKE